MYLAVSNPINSYRRRVGFVMTALAISNIIAWLATWQASSGYIFLLGSGWLAYSFGLRHAVDADHISAIDNVTRKLSQDGKRPVTVGLFFSLGHSTVVILLCAGLALASTYVQAHISHLQAYGGTIGTIISGVFLYIIGIINLIVLYGQYRGYRAQKQSGNDASDRAMIQLTTGLLGRILTPALRLVSHSWQMYFVGLLFGLGFDTATEVGILAISARSANQGIAFGVVMLLPILFTVGMCLIDTLDGIFMSGAYGWVSLNPSRQFRYNISITLVSILVAFSVGSYEMAQLAADRLWLHGTLWQTLNNLDSGYGGLAIVVVFALIWGAAALSARRSRTTIPA